MTPNIPDEKVAELSELIFRGEMIPAIKLYRELTGTGLKEAKDAVEALEAQMRTDSPEKFTVPPRDGKGARKVAIVFGLIAFAVGIYVFSKLK